jgi:phenylpyruvate tautomerase PptA (4-oxalocrotonate tautomerase family)
MPVIQISVMEGYDDDAKGRICAALSDAVRLVVPAPAEAVTVLVQEVAPAGYMRGREHRQPAPALPDPGQVVRDYLAAMEAREIERARAMLAPGFTMVFPATGEMHRLEELIEWAAPRYRFVTKTYEGFDAMQSASEAALVYARGTLSGEWPDGTPFSGIRFIDRFELVGGKITRQDVWNDMGEVKAKS